MDPIDFGDLEPLEVPVKYKGRTYTLREASADAGIKYQRAVLLNGEVVKGEDGIEKFVPRQNTDITPSMVLLANCLFDEDGKLVPETVIRQWPYRVWSKLTDWIREHSPDLFTVREEPSKNGLTPGEYPGQFTPSSSPTPAS